MERLKIVNTLQCYFATCETGNRIVNIFSEKALEVMQIAKNWHLDGTFKNC